MHNRNTHKHKTVNLLTEINGLFNKEATRSLGLFLLNDIDASKLAPKLFLKYCFLKGKHFTILYKSSPQKNIEFLHQANLWFDQLVQYAANNQLKMEQDYFQLRIKTKWLIISHVSDADQKSKMISRLKVICENALHFYPKNPAILSLLKTLQS